MSTPKPDTEHAAARAAIRAKLKALAAPPTKEVSNTVTLTFLPAEDGTARRNPNPAPSTGPVPKRDIDTRVRAAFAPIKTFLDYLKGKPNDGSIVGQDLYTHAKAAVGRGESACTDLLAALERMPDHVYTDGSDPAADSSVWPLDADRAPNPNPVQANHHRRLLARFVCRRLNVTDPAAVKAAADAATATAAGTPEANRLAGRTAGEAAVLGLLDYFENYTLDAVAGKERDDTIQALQTELAGVASISEFHRSDDDSVSLEEWLRYEWGVGIRSKVKLAAAHRLETLLYQMGGLTADGTGKVLPEIKQTMREIVQELKT